VPVTWIPTFAVDPHPHSDTDFTALDGDLAIGYVYRIEKGPKQGWWQWSMIADLSVPHFRDRGGTAPTQTNAMRRVEWAYERLQRLQRKNR
jgi:hypothetical protein